jgi:sec-independent protein translocase protein TatA
MAAPLIQMPQGAEWLIILAIVVLLFGSAKLPALVKQLGKSKKIWEEEVGPKKKNAELTEEASQAPAQEQVQQPAQQSAQQAQAAQQPNQVNGQAPGDGLPPSHTAN